VGFRIRVGGRVSHLHEVWVVSKYASVFDVGLFDTKETLCLLLSQGVVGFWIYFVLTVDPYTAG